MKKWVKVMAVVLTFGGLIASIVLFYTSYYKVAMGVGVVSLFLLLNLGEWYSTKSASHIYHNKRK